MRINEVRDEQRGRPAGSQRGRRVALAVAGVALVAYGVSGGCYAQKLPAATAGAATTLSLDVVVVPWDTTKRHQNPQAYQRAALAALDGANMFHSVRAGAVGDSTADLYAESTGSYCNSAVVPMLSILSLGIIPTIFTDHDCDGVTFRPARNPALAGDSVTVAFDLQTRTVMGWLAVPIGWLPGWTHGEAKQSRPARDARRAAILRHRDALMRLSGSMPSTSAIRGAASDARRDASPNP
jgi:hypothetical protein